MGFEISFGFYFWKFLGHNDNHMSQLLVCLFLFPIFNLLDTQMCVWACYLLVDLLCGLCVAEGHSCYIFQNGHLHSAVTPIQQCHQRAWVHRPIHNGWPDTYIIQSYANKRREKKKKMVKQRSGAQNENGKKIELKFYPATFWETTCCFFFYCCNAASSHSSTAEKSKLEMLHWRLNLFLRCTIGPAGTHRFDLPFLPRRLGWQLWNLTPKMLLCSWPRRRSWLISSHDVSTLCWCSCHDNCDNRWGEK